MSDKSLSPPSGASWIWHTLDLIESDAWRSRGVHGSKLVDFLEREYLRAFIATQENQNGELKAPQNQLEDCGIGARYVSAAIELVERIGLVDVRRRALRVANTYSLTWLPTKDGKPATNRWREYRDPTLKPLPVPKIQKSAPQREGSAAPQREGRSRNLPLKGKADFAENAENLPLKGKDLSRFLATEVTTAPLVEPRDVVLDAAADPLIVDGWRVPDCWLAGPQLKPALSGVAEVIAAMRRGKAAAEARLPVEPDAWLRDGFYSLRRRAGARYGAD